MTIKEALKIVSQHKDNILDNKLKEALSFLYSFVEARTYPQNLSKNKE